MKHAKMNPKIPSKRETIDRSKEFILDKLPEDLLPVKHHQILKLSAPASRTVFFRSGGEFGFEDALAA